MGKRKGGGGGSRQFLDLLVPLGKTFGEVLGPWYVPNRFQATPCPKIGHKVVISHRWS